MKASEVERIILTHTGHRVRNLRVELSPEQITLCGETASFYVKQLAQESVRALLPTVRLSNTIVVQPHVDHWAAAEAS